MERLHSALYLFVIKTLSEFSNELKCKLEQFESILMQAPKHSYNVDNSSSFTIQV